MSCLKNHPSLWISIKETTHQKVKILSLLSNSAGFLNQPILYMRMHVNVQENVQLKDVVAKQARDCALQVAVVQGTNV